MVMPVEIVKAFYAALAQGDAPGAPKPAASRWLRRRCQAPQQE
jgi:hypothetical protein